MPSSHLILCRPLLLLPPIPPSIRLFSNESTLCMRGPKYWSFSFSIIPSREIPGLISFRMDWLDLLAVQGFNFGECFGALLGPTTEPVITGCHIKSTFYCTIQLRNVSLLLCRIREEDTSKGWLFFDFQAAHEAPTCRGFSPFQFASNAE